ncbi:YhcN/YlaJ family sporulation lipoprotein [Lysinibacillus boronitolerans]|uniref:YhcN/YlaJ family sporulation lipoprotein n=2 Tax=Lysinibacillus boronitolerans TaxID=309788 RepID=UPI0021628294|nr:YhcN/YlaJ family sporulation lipoprotein [Lysinibacillus boronitolerans]MCS1392227.1 YhcN/YlaJ family sporulation lipoprotein [Lysinibacillus boronitolerans]
MFSKIKIVKAGLLIIMAFGLCTGCNGNHDQHPNKDLNNSQVSRPISQSVANQATENIILEDEISKVMAVNTDKDLLVAIKVKQFDRFRLKKIEKKIKSDLEKQYPDYSILVSADQKMYFELVKLDEKLQKNTMSMKNLQKDTKKIKSLMKEQS